MLRQVLIATAIFSMTGLAVAATPAKVGNTTLGKVLVDEKGMTLYTFTKDSEGKSACNGPCAKNWPPLMAPAGAKSGDGYTVVQRDDGSQQWAYKGQPLYTWVKDSKPGETTGEGVNQVWHVAKP